MIVIPQPLIMNKEVKWEIEMLNALEKRRDYVRSEGSMRYTQIAGHFMGVFEDVESYLEYLFLIANEPTNEFECLFKGLDRTLDNSLFQQLQKVIQIQEKSNLSMNRFIAFLEGNQLLPLRNSIFYARYRTGLKTIFEMVKDKAIFKRVVIDLIKWSWNHIEPLQYKCNFETKPPRYLWYGDAKESESYFLYLLFLTGFDVISFHPSNKDIFTHVIEHKMPVVRYDVFRELIPFPLTKPTRRTTIAQKATTKLNEVIYDDTGIFRAWQLRDYIPAPLTLHTTYDEVFLLQPEKAMYRQGFAVAEMKVEIPNIFAKVAGVTKNRSQYKAHIKTLLKGHKLVYAVDHFPMITGTISNMQLHYQSSLEEVDRSPVSNQNATGIGRYNNNMSMFNQQKQNTNQRLSPTKIIQSSYWPYKILPLPLQQGLASVIARVVFDAALKSLPNETLEEKRWYLFAQLMLLPKPILQLLQQFDYSQEVPCILLFNDEGRPNITRTDACALLLLNQMGFDIILFSPTGQSDIELFIEESLYDAHWLEEMVFDEGFLKDIRSSSDSANTSFFKSLFNKFK